jgi:hypothetical protein
MNKQVFPLALIVACSLAGPRSALAADSLFEALVYGFFQGMSEEAGRRAASALLDSAGSYQAPSTRSRSFGNYTITSCGSVRDQTTGLEWFIGPDRTLTWHQSNQWIANLGACGGGWRMPSISEILSLYNPSYTAGIGYYTGGKHWPAKIHPVFGGIGNGSWVWSNKTLSGSRAKSVNLNQGVEVVYSQSNSKYTTRAFAVR